MYFFIHKTFQFTKRIDCLGLLLSITFIFAISMRQPAGVAEILRSHQKDDIYTGYLKSAVSEIFQEIFGL